MGNIEICYHKRAAIICEACEIERKDSEIATLRLALEEKDRALRPFAAFAAEDFTRYAASVGPDDFKCAAIALASAAGKIVEALEFYADIQNWKKTVAVEVKGESQPHMATLIGVDHGEIARNAMRLLLEPKGK